jgi:hypothetical protein
MASNDAVAAEFPTEALECSFYAPALPFDYRLPLLLLLQA